MGKKEQSLEINGAGKTEYSIANESSWTPTFHHTQKLTQNRLKT